MAKNYSCPKCGVALVFNPQTQNLHCEYCGTSFTVDEVRESEFRLEEMIRRMNAGADTEENDGEEYETISMKILRCSSCGAELASREEETSSYCAYCGQPTIVTERLQDCRRPDFIIPFKVTKERAERLVREQIAGGGFIPNEIRNFEPERICGIYIPYWLFDVYTSDGQLWKYNDGDDNTYYGYYAADSVFQRVTSEASRRFNDYFSAKLEPYRMDEVMRFDETYLSGFYSDQFDVSREEAGAQTRLRAKRLFSDKITERRKERHAWLISSKPVAEEFRARYALLPVWFMTTRYRNKPYTVLVNGQTGKTVCSMPVNKARAYGLFASVMAGVFALLMLLFTLINNKIFNMDTSGAGQRFIFFAVYVPVAAIAAVLLWSGFSAIKRLFRIRSGIRVAASDSNRNFSRERQG